MERVCFALCVNPRDNVATLFADGVYSGCTVHVRDKAGTVSEITALDEIPYAHKIAVCNINKGEFIYKYGEIIGIATRAIKIGEHVHIHNLDSTRARGDLTEG